MYRKKTMFRGRKPAVKKAAPKRAYKRTVAKSIKAIVRREISKDAEVKKVYDVTLAQQFDIKGTGLDYGPQTLGFTSNSLIPNPALGTSSAARIGNRVNVKALNVRYSLYANPSTEASYSNPFICLPFLVKVVVYRARFSTSSSDPSGIINDGATSGNLSSVPDTFFRPYNRDQFEIGYSKVHKMQPPRHVIGLPANNNFTGQSQDPRIASYVVRSFNLKMPKHLLYNDNASAYPTNAAWYMSVCVCNIDGTTATTLQSRVKLNLESYLMFTDE